MINLLAVGTGGFVGAVARYLLSSLVHRALSAAFPYGTLVVNVVGCLAIGALMYFVEDRGTLGPGARLFLGIGILGGFTTFSSFSHETIELVARGQTGLAALNVAGSVVLGLGAVWAGRALMRAVGA